MSITLNSKVVAAPEANPFALSDEQKVRILTKHRTVLGIQQQLQQAATQLNDEAIAIAAERHVDLKEYQLDLDRLEFGLRPQQ